jgi:hypothetical protein
MKKSITLVKIMTVVIAVAFTIPAFAHHEEVPESHLSVEVLHEQNRLEAGIRQLEMNEGKFSLNLYDPVMALGVLFHNSGRYYQAAESFRRTQHLIHRAKGVHAEEQIPSIDKLMLSLSGTGDFHGLDTQQHFRFRVASRSFVIGDDRLSAAKVKLADWYRATARFEEALSLYDEVRSDFEGRLSTDVEVRILRSEALTMFLANRCCAAEKLLSAYEVINDAATAGGVERRDAFSDYQDMAAMERRSVDDQSLARSSRYLGFATSRDVLRMMALKKPISMSSKRYVDFGDIDAAAVPVKAMGHPVAMCSHTFGQLVSREPSATELEISLTVTDHGHARNIRVEGDMPPKLKRYIMQSLKLGRYQTATNEDGVNISAELSFTQTFNFHDQPVSSRNQVPDWGDMLVAQTCQTRGLQRI